MLFAKAFETNIVTSVSDISNRNLEVRDETTLQAQQTVSECATAVFIEEIFHTVSKKLQTL